MESVSKLIPFSNAGKLSYGYALGQKYISIPTLTLLFASTNLVQKNTRKQAFGCFSVVSSNMIEGLLKRKYCPRLKLV